MKLAVPIFLANFLFNKKLPIQRKEIFISLLIILSCFFVVFRQPDLGTAIIIACSGLFVLFLSGLSWGFMGGSFVLLILSSPFIWNILLQPFQRQRIATFFNQDIDPFGASWNIIQSKVAIGSGGFFGKGFREGSQTQLNFLPETETDFIFSVIGEEFGFIGSIVLIFIFGGISHDQMSFGHELEVVFEVPIAQRVNTSEVQTSMLNVNIPASRFR